MGKVIWCRDTPFSPISLRRQQDRWIGCTEDRQNLAMHLRKPVTPASLCEVCRRCLSDELLDDNKRGPACDGLVASHYTDNTCWHQCSRDTPHTPCDKTHWTHTLIHLGNVTTRQTLSPSNSLSHWKFMIHPILFSNLHGSFFSHRLYMYIQTGQ